MNEAKSAPRPALEVLRELQGGRLLHELGVAYAELAKAVLDARKGGSVRLTVTLKPASKKIDNALVASADIDSKLPELAKPDTILFTDERGALTKKDPRQTELALEAVREERAETIDHETGEVRYGRQ